MDFIKTYLLQITPDPQLSSHYRGVSGFLIVGGQVVMQVVVRRGATAGGAFYSAKK